MEIKPRFRNLKIIWGYAVFVSGENWGVLVFLKILTTCQFYCITQFGKLSLQ